MFSYQSITYLSFRKSVLKLTGSLCFVFAFAGPCVSQAAAVHAGYDLFNTPNGAATFMGFDFTGVPLGTYDFEKENGNGTNPVNVGNTDTIIRRLDNVTDEDGSTGLQMLALQLVTSTQVDMGAGLDFYYITLADNVDSLGTMNIFGIDDGVDKTFESTLKVNFELHKGSLDGNVILAKMLELTSTNSPWGRTSPDDALLIYGKNINLNGTDTTNDFWGFPEEQHPSGAKHDPIPAVPEPTTLALFALGGLGLSRSATGARQAKGSGTH